MKSINIKLTLSVAQKLDERGQLNPQYLNYFITHYLLKSLPSEPIDELSYNYTFKIDNDVHRSVKLKAIEHNLPMNEFLGRLLLTYY